MSGLVAIFFLVSGCSDEKESSTSYEGVGKLVAERNQARFRTSADLKKGSSSGAKDSQASSDNKGKPSEMLVEEEVRLVSLSSGKTIGAATVYFDKNGTIINIRVKK